MASVDLHVKGKEVKVVHDNGVVSHVFECNDLSVNSILSQLNKEIKEYDLDNYYVDDVIYL